MRFLMIRRRRFRFRLAIFAFSRYVITLRFDAYQDSAALLHMSSRRLVADYARYFEVR